MGRRQKDFRCLMTVLIENLEAVLDGGEDAPLPYPEMMF